MVKVERGYDRSFSPMSSLRNLGKGTAFHSLSRLDLDENTSVSLSRYFNHGLLEHFPVDLSPIFLLRRRLPASQKLAVAPMAALSFLAGLVLTDADERHLDRETL